MEKLNSQLLQRLISEAQVASKSREDEKKTLLMAALNRSGIDFNSREDIEVLHFTPYDGTSIVRVNDVYVADVHNWQCGDEEIELFIRQAKQS